MLCRGQDYGNSLSRNSLRMFKKGRGLMGLRVMCQIHPRNCPTGLRKRTSEVVSNLPDTASITQVYLQNKHSTLRSLYKLANEFLDLKQKRHAKTYGERRKPVKSYEEIVRPVDTYDEIQRPVETYEELQRPIETYGDINRPVETFDEIQRPVETYGDIMYDKMFRFEGK